MWLRRKRAQWLSTVVMPDGMFKASADLQMHSAVPAQAAPTLVSAAMTLGETRSARFVERNMKGSRFWVEGF